MRSNLGVDVILDQWDLRIGSDLSLYMEQGLSAANLVLCVCSDTYVDKANSGLGGTGYEKMIMTAALLSNSASDYIIPIKRNNFLGIMPTFLSTKLYIDFSADSNYIEQLSVLVYRIFNEDIALKPSLGKNPFSSKNASDLDVQIALQRTQYHDININGTASFNYLNNSGDFTIGTGEYQFTTHWSKCGDDTIYAYKDRVRHIGYSPEFTTFPDKKSLRNYS